jgi:hypothetical protein
MGLPGVRILNMILPVILDVENVESQMEKMCLPEVQDFHHVST